MSSALQNNTRPFLFFSTDEGERAAAADLLAGDVPEHRVQARTRGRPCRGDGSGSATQGAPSRPRHPGRSSAGLRFRGTGSLRNFAEEGAIVDTIYRLVFRTPDYFRMIFHISYTVTPFHLDLDRYHVGNVKSRSTSSRIAKVEIVRRTRSSRSSIYDLRSSDSTRTLENRITDIEPRPRHVRREYWRRANERPTAPTTARRCSPPSELGSPASRCPWCRPTASWCTVCKFHRQFRSPLVMTIGVVGAGGGEHTARARTVVTSLLRDTTFALGSRAGGGRTSRVIKPLHYGDVESRELRSIAVPL